MLAVAVALLGLAPLASALYEALGGAMLPCPDVQPQQGVDIDQLLGTWHLSLLVVDATEEDFVESGICVSGELLRHNQTTMRQLWTVQTTGEREGQAEPVAQLDLPTTVIHSGIWAVHTPLGGELKGTVFECEPLSYMLVSNCGWHHGSLVHLWTAAITRAPVISYKLRRYLTSALEEHGFHPQHSKVVSWHGC